MRLNQIRFSIVTPVKDEAKFLERSLPSFYEINPDEVIICTDDPTPHIIKKTVKEIATRYQMISKTKIHPVPRNPEYSYHQAWVRRSGFLTAKNDTILTSDVDLQLNKNVLEAIELVGKNNIGMITLTKLRYPYNKLGFLRFFGIMILRLLYSLIFNRLVYSDSGKGLRMTLFSGLYVLYRPYWLDSEDDGVKKMVPTVWKQKKGEKIDNNAYNVGEDNYLRDCMEKKHKVLYLTRIGAVVIDRDKHAHPGLQFQRGRYSAKRGRSFLGAVIHTILHIEPNYFKGYLFERQQIRGIN